MLYDLAIVIYDFIVHLAAPFSRKPRKMMKGHWVVYELLRQQVEKGEQYIWFHAASLGEFEQGRPLIEMIRAKYFPDLTIRASVNKLRRWMRRCKPLMNEILSTDFHPKTKAFSVREVRLITYYLGKPGEL